MKKVEEKEFGSFTEEELNGIELEMEEKNFFYSYNMIFDLNLSEHAKILYLFLCRKANDKCVSFPSYSSMGNACSFSRTTAIRALKELMTMGLVIKKRQGNGIEQTVNKYMIFSSPKEDLKEKNAKQLDRELKEYRERRDSGIREMLEGNVRETPEGSIRETLGSVRETPGSVRETPEVQPIEGIPIEGINSSSSFFDVVENKEIKKETIQLVKEVYDKMLASKAKTIQIGNEKIDMQHVKEVLRSLNANHIKQVCDYIEQQKIYSLNAIRTALYNSPEQYLLLQIQNEQPKGGGVKKRGNRFNNFPQRNYDSEEFYELEKELLKQNMKVKPGYD